MVERSKDILAQLEEEHLDAEGRAKIARPQPQRRTEFQLTLFGAADHPLLDEIRQVDLNATAPLEAMRMIQQWQQSLLEEKQGGKAKRKKST